MRDSIVAEARTWLDTPYLHQGRRKGHGVDCLGLVIGFDGQAIVVEWFDSHSVGRETSVESPEFLEVISTT